MLRLSNLALLAGCSAAAAAAPPIAWQFAGPGGYINNGDSPPMVSASATQAAVGQADGSWLIGTTNGGVWRSKDISPGTAGASAAAAAKGVSWTPVTDGQPVNCSSIGALTVSEDTKGLAYAGCGGSTSSEMGAGWNVLNSGDWAGIMETKDYGESWTMMEGTPFANYYITAILSGAKGTLVVSARSNLYDKDDGGIWHSEPPKSAGGPRRWKRVSSKPTFNLHSLGWGALLAGYAHSSDSVGVSHDGGRTWSAWDTGIAWASARHQPYYATFASAHGNVFYGAYTVDLDDDRKTNSKVWMASASATGAGKWTEVSGAGTGAPLDLDGDSMPKDRMALLADPDDANVLYAAGNGGYVAYRIDIKNKKWAVMTSDTADGSAPHCDCRNFAWDAKSKSLLLVSDGGIWARSLPATKGGGGRGGRWTSLNGDMGAMEFLSAHWDPFLKRWVAGAQDNDVQASVPDSVAHPSAVAFGFVMGDGTITDVDASQPPARLWGARQFMGSMLDLDSESKRTSKRRGGDRDEDEGEGEGRDGDEDAEPLGLCYVEGHPEKTTCIDLTKWGFEPPNFPYFVHPFALNKLAPTNLVFWAAQTSNISGGFYSLAVPRDSVAELSAPVRLANHTGGVLAFVAGGKSASGAAQLHQMVAMNGTHLITSDDITASKTERKLPVAFAEPLILGFDSNNQLILGPVSHGSTVSLAVSPADGATVAVSGRPSITDNGGEESIWLSTSGGQSWTNITGDFEKQVSATGQPRPSALLLLPVSKSCTVVLVGTVSGVYVSSAAAAKRGRWSRLGGWAKFPRVLVMGLSHEPSSDTLVAATMGRGVYIAHNASAALASAC